MIQVVFRFKYNNEEAWVGYTNGVDWEDIFWGIDEFGDPYEADVVRVSNCPIGYCVAWDNNDEFEGWLPINNWLPEKKRQLAEVELSCRVINDAPDEEYWEKPNRAWERHLRTRLEALRGTK